MEIIIAIIFYSVLAFLSGNSDKRHSSNSDSKLGEDIDNRFSNVWDIDFNGKGIDPKSAWGKIRLAAFKRDNYRCVKCSAATNLTVNHKVQLKLGGKNDLNNLETLCKGCHESLHNRIIFDSNLNFKDIDNYGENPRLNPKIINLRNAIDRSENITINYVDGKNNKTLRVVAPQNLFEEHSVVYLRSYCYLRHQERTFRVSRMTIV